MAVSYAHRPTKGPIIKADLYDLKVSHRPLSFVMYDEHSKNLALPSDEMRRTDMISDTDIDEAVCKIASYIRRDREEYKADLGTPADGPVWTVVGNYEDEPYDFSVFHIHAQDLDHLSSQIYKAKALYIRSMEEGWDAEKQDKAGCIPSDFRSSAIFKGALYSEV